MFNASTATKDKIEQIKEVIATTDTIDRMNTEQIVELQDLCNMDGATAYKLWEDLKDKPARHKLLWIMTAVSGFDLFSWFLTYGVAPHFDAEMRERYKDREWQLHEKEKKIDNKINLYHEQHGEIITRLRRQVNQLQDRLENEKHANRKVKALLKVLRGYIPIV